MSSPLFQRGTRGTRPRQGPAKVRRHCEPIINETA
jgi:hypothetical protein